jgi:zinc protease
MNETHAVGRSAALHVQRAVLAGLVIAVAGCAAADKPTFTIKHAEQRGRIDANGLRFVIMPDPSTTLVEVDVRFDVGAREDPQGKAGLAHLVEHLLFQIRPGGPGTPTLMDHLSQIAVARNAYTTWDKTHYEALAPAAAIEALLQIEATRLYYGCSEIPEAEFAREREVVRNELRQRYGSPQGQIYPKALAAIYPEGHAYARIPGGDDEQVAGLTLADACEFVTGRLASLLC